MGSRRRSRFRHAAGGCAHRPPCKGGGRDKLRQRGHRPDRSSDALCVSARAQRDRSRGAQSRSARSYPLWRAALDRVGGFSLFRRVDAFGKERDRPRDGPALACASAEHLELAQEAGDALLRRGGGWIKAFRSARGEDMANREAEELKPYGIKPTFLDRAALLALEPHLSERAIGGAHYSDPLSTPDPEALAHSYAALFVKRGGRMETGDALSLEPAGTGWMVKTASGRLAARDVVIALGPWSNELARRFGLHVPFFVKRGYHMHYEAQGNKSLTRPVLDLERGYLVTPMTRGLRLTTGAEFARADDRPSSAQLDRVEPFARELFPIGARKEPKPWLGRRPCLPGYAADHRAVPRQTRSMARFRPPSPRAQRTRSGHWPAPGGPDDRRSSRRRSGALPGGAVRVKLPISQQLRAAIIYGANCRSPARRPLTVASRKYDKTGPRVRAYAIAGGECNGCDNSDPDIAPGRDRRDFRRRHPPSRFRPQFCLCRLASSSR